MSPGTYEIPQMDPLPNLLCQVCVSSSGIRFKYNQKAVGYPYNICTTIVPWASLAVLAVIIAPRVRRVMDLSPTSLIAPSVIVKVIHQGGSFPASTELIDFSMPYDFSNNETFIPRSTLKPLETVRALSKLLLKT